MDIESEVRRWQEKATDVVIADQLAQLLEAGDRGAVDDAFFQELAFGTGGLRGIMGPGTNRMNIYTVGRATQGLADFLNSLPAPDDASRRMPSVAIAHDSRHKGELFAKEAARVLAANGIRAYLYPRLEPTPALSFATRYLHCDAGINITASHNPAQYNGYKAYGPDGCQITSEYAEGIQKAIDAVDLFEGVNRVDFDAARTEGMIEYLDESVIQAFLDAVLAQDLEGADSGRAPLKVVYTPLNGTGLECVTAILERVGVADIVVVPEQAMPDGDFPTCPYPNPEFKEALEPGLALCEREKPDLLLATDPDADRVGVASRDTGGYTLINGNEMGVLLLDYVCRVRSAHGTMPENPVAISTIVSSDMATAVAGKYGVELVRVLTGFKYIGEVIGELEAAGEEDRFIFGYEESYGYLSGTHVRDKDAVNASMLICQMARYYAGKGMTLIDAIKALYDEHGYFVNAAGNYRFAGASGPSDMAALMDGLRAEPPTDIAGFAVEGVVDYLPGVGRLPSSNVLQFDLEGGNKMLIRPSGTEPKLKAYLFAVDETREGADEIAERLRKAADSMLEKQGS